MKSVSGDGGRRPRPTSSSWMPWASPSRTSRHRSRWTASRRCRSTRSWAWWRRAWPTPTSSPPWPSRLARLGPATGRSEQHRKIAEPGRRARTCTALAGGPAEQPRRRRPGPAGQRRRSGCPRARSRPSEQLEQVQGEMMAEALKPFHDPKLRDLIVTMKKSLEQVIDEVTQDELLQAGFDARSLEKAQALVDGLPGVHRGEQGRAGGDPGVVQPPVPGRAAVPAGQGVGRGAEAARRCRPRPSGSGRRSRPSSRQAVKGKGGKPVTDLIALVRHALDPASADRAVRHDGRGAIPGVARRAGRAGASSSPPSSASGSTPSGTTSPGACGSTRTTSTYAPFSQLGGLGRVHDLFGERLPAILEELNGRLAA